MLSLLDLFSRPCFLYAIWWTILIKSPTSFRNSSRRCLHTSTCCQHSDSAACFVCFWIRISHNKSVVVKQFIFCILLPDIESFLLFTTRSDVRRITLGTPDQSDVVIPLSNTVSTMAVDFDDDNDTIYWTDSGTNTISASKWDGSEERVRDP